MAKRTGGYLDEDKFVATLGGDHSISLGPIRAYAKRYTDLSILHFDAHCDLRDSYEGNPFSHASIMRRVLELGCPIVSVGIRSMDSSERVLSSSIRTFFGHELAAGVEPHAIYEALSPTVYITFDVDALDPSIMPATGTPEPGGLDWRQTLSILRHVFSHRNVVGLDIVEFMPIDTLKAPAYLAAKLLYKMIAYKNQSGA